MPHLSIKVDINNNSDICEIIRSSDVCQTNIYAYCNWLKYVTTQDTPFNLKLIRKKSVSRTNGYTNVEIMNDKNWEK